MARPLVTFAERVAERLRHEGQYDSMTDSYSIKDAEGKLLLWGTREFVRDEGGE